MENLKDFWKKCPDQLGYPIDIWIAGGILWRGYATEDIDIALEGDTNNQIKTVKSLQQLTPVSIKAQYAPPYGTCHAPLYVAGKKVASCPVCPPHRKWPKELIYDLAKEISEIKIDVEKIKIKLKLH